MPSEETRTTPADERSKTPATGGATPPRPNEPLPVEPLPDVTDDTPPPDIAGISEQHRIARMDE